MLACVTSSRISPDGRDRRRQCSSPIWLDAAVMYLGRRQSDAVIRRGESKEVLIAEMKKKEESTTSKPAAPEAAKVIPNEPDAVVVTGTTFL